MEVTPTALPGVLLIEPRVFRDDRGSFLETWRRDHYETAGVPATFVQDNAAISYRGVLRGLHYQWPEPQGKLVSVLHGEVFDVAVDIRRGSPFFGRWVGERLSSENGRQLWIPEGFAHGYAALSDTAVFAYKCTRVYVAEADRSIRWDDPQVGVDWQIRDPVLSTKDAGAPLLRDLTIHDLPSY